MNEVNKVYNGNCEDILKSVHDNSIHICITSIPYNIGIEYDGYADNLPLDEYLTFIFRIFEQIEKKLVSGGRFCIVVGETKDNNQKIPLYAICIRFLLELRMLYRADIIWNKNNTANPAAYGSFKSPSCPQVVPRHEHIIIFSKDSYKLEGDSKKIDITDEEFNRYTNPIWNIAPAKGDFHPASFPQEIVYRLLKFLSFQDNIVMDPFAGIGTTGIVAKKLGRNYILIEQSKKYCEIAERMLNIIKQDQQQNEMY